MVKLLKYSLFIQCLCLCLIPIISCADTSDNGIAFNDVASNHTASTDTDSTKSATVTLYLLGYDVPKSERERVVVKDIAIFNKYLKKHAAIKDIDELLEEKSPTYQRSTYKTVRLSALTLCESNYPLKCLKNIEDNHTPYTESLKSIPYVIDGIDTLKKSDASELVSVFPDNLWFTSAPIPDYNYLTRTLMTQSVLAHYKDPYSGSKTVCDNISFSKKLIQSKHSLIQTMVGVKLLNSYLDLLAHSTGPLSLSCTEALIPMTAKEISVCPEVKNEAKQLKNMLLSFDETPILFSHDASIKLVDEDTQLFCNAEWTNNIKDDEITSYPINDIKTAVLFNRTGSMLVNMAKVDYSDYQNRLLDTNAHLRLWQAAIDPQCQDAVSNPEVLDSLFMGEYSHANAPLVNYLNTFLADLNRIRAPRIDDQKRFTITAYDQSNNTIENSKVNTADDLSYISVSCRTVQ